MDFTQNSIPPELPLDLLKLTWWQNPWYAGALAGLCLLLVAAALAWYLWRRRPATAEELFLKRLAIAYALPRASQQEQSNVYGLLTSAIKEYGAAVLAQPAADLHGLTDQEFVRILYAHEAPQTFASAVEALLAAGCEVKFAQTVIAASALQTHIVQLQVVVEQLREQKKIPKQS